MNEKHNAAPSNGGSEQSEHAESPHADPPIDDADLSGVNLDDRFRIIERIGTGAGSEVYMAEHKLLDELVAIKILKKDLLQSKSSIERFKREAKIATRLQHPNIVKLKWFGLSNDGEPFMVMELCQGVSLEQNLLNRALPPGLAVAIVKQIASALAYAHELGVIHRDVKPANILLVGSPESQLIAPVKLLDFGLAKDLSLNDGGKDALTKAAFMLGTPNYMSPEQCRSQSVDARTDIYSLGCVLYECVTGRKPFEADTDLAVMDKHANAEATFEAKDNVSPELKAIILKCLQKDPAHRYQNANELVAALDQLSTLPSKRHHDPALTGMALALVACCLGLGGILILFTQQPKTGKPAVDTEKPAAPQHISKITPLGKPDPDPTEIFKEADESTRSPLTYAKPDYEKAIRLYKIARQGALKKHEPILAARCQLELGSIYQFNGELDIAEPFLKQAVAELRKIQDSPYLSEALLALGRNAYLRHDGHTALPYFQEAWSACPDIPNRKIAIRRFIAETLAYNGDFAAAEVWHADNQKVLGALPVDDSVRRDRTMDDFSNIKIQLGAGNQKKLQESIDCSITDLKNCTDPGDVSDLASGAVDCAILLNEKHQPELARRLLDSALSRLDPRKHPLAAARAKILQQKL